MSGIRYRRGLYWGQIENVELLSQIKTNERFAIKDNQVINTVPRRFHKLNRASFINMAGLLALTAAFATDNENIAASWHRD